MTKTKKLNLKWVSDTIGEEYKQWINGSVITMQAQTGTGKSFFIQNQLIPYAVSRSKSILYIVNRKTLKKQTKFDVAEAQGIDLSKKTDEEIDKMSQIGSVYVTTYHSIQEYLIDKDYNITNEIKYKNFDYIVMDECHYIIQDASFNNKTVFFFKDFLKQYNHNSITIYISATMEYIRKPILSSIENILGTVRHYDYSTGTDYSYINTYYFKKEEDIVNTINNDDSGQKWIVFVSSVRAAKYFLEEVKDSKLICSDSNELSNRMDRDELQSIVKDSKFNCKCLVATKAMDNGVNLKDDLLTNVVIFSFDRIDFIQMLGRKRIDINNPQQVNLHLCSKDIRSFHALNNMMIAPRQKALDLYNEDHIAFAREYDITTNKMQYTELFYIDKNSTSTCKWQINFTGKIMFVEQKYFYQRMINDFKTFGENAFINEQLLWINQPYNKDNWIINVLDNKEVKKLIEYLDSLIGIKVLEEDQIKLKEMLMQEGYGISKQDIKGLKKMHIETFNSIMNNELNLPYKAISTRTSKRIDGKPIKYTYWTILKTIE